MNSGDFMEDETELELVVRECSHMMLNLEKLEKPFWMNLGASDNNIEIGAIPLKSVKGVTCKLTKNPCVLYNPGNEANPLAHIEYKRLNWCPSSEDSVKKYKLKGIQREHNFCVFKIERIGGE